MPFRNIRVVPFRVIGKKVHAALVKEGGRLGLRIDSEASVGEILGDLGQSGGLARAGTAGEYDIGDFFPHIGLSFQSAKINILSEPLFVRRIPLQRDN